MAQISIQAASVSLRSAWTVVSRRVYNAAGEWTGETRNEYTRPSTDSATRVFDLSALPSAAVIDSAVLTARPTGVPAPTMNGSTASRQTLDTADVTPGGNMTIAFSFTYETPYGSGAKPDVTYSRAEYAGWETPTLTIAYHIPYAAPGAPTTVSLSSAAPAPGEALKLSWAGARPGNGVAIAGYAVYRAAKAAGEYALLTAVSAAVTGLQVAAPEAPGGYYYRVKTLGDKAGYDSALSDAYAAAVVTVTAPAPPADVSVSPSVTYPGGAATIRWSGALPGQSNAITGYAVYRAESAAGEFTLLQAVGTQESSLQTTAPAKGAAYFRVAALGAHMDGEMSAAAASLTADSSLTSDFSLSPAVVDAGSALTITLSGHTDKAHTLTLSIGEYTQTVAMAAGESEVSVTPPLTWLNALPTRETGELTIALFTAGAGTVTRTATLRCPDSVRPAVPQALLTRLDGDVPAAWGVWVAGKSRAKLTLSAAPQTAYGAPILSYRVTGGGADIGGDSLPLTAETGFLTAGTHIFTVTATDARGRSSVQTIAVEAAAYFAPTLRNILTLRCTQGGAEDDEGVYAHAEAEAVYASCGGKNSVSTLVSYRAQGDADWVEAGALADGELVFGGELLATENYDVRYRVADAFGQTAVYYDVVTRAKPEIHIGAGGGAWAFGGMADRPGALKVYGDLAVSGVIAASGLFTYDEATDTLTIAPHAGTFSFDAASGTLHITG